MSPSSTICAVSTPPGQGGIAVIRVSGNHAIASCDKLFVPARNDISLTAPSVKNSVVFGKIVKMNEVIDEVLVTVFRAPHSYTGEDTVEISCHGSVFIQQEILKLLLANGCRMATAGEFTQRAFMNGKLDLAQAEAVGDLIASSSAAAHRMAMRQMRGDYSTMFARLHDELLHFATMVELELDFSEEEVEFADRKQLLSLASHIESIINRLSASFATGNAIKNGIPVAIVGETNAGKSTLLNRLLHEDKAIVSDIHGTTRDAIEDTMIMGGVLFRFIDTAGIRSTTDRLEQLGIERTFRKMEKAAVVLWVIDLTAADIPVATIYEKAPPSDTRRLILVLNKADRLPPEQLAAKQSPYKDARHEVVVISARSGEGMDELEQKLIDCIPPADENDIIISNLRHYEALTKATEAIRRTVEGLENNIPNDLLAQDIRECLNHLGRITGRQIHAEDVLENIFRNFCIGK
jgi:tRNA modification GTPase